MTANLFKIFQPIIQLWQLFYSKINNAKYIDNTWLLRLHNDYWYLSASIMTVTSAVLAVVYSPVIFYVTMSLFLIYSAYIKLTVVRRAALRRFTGELVSLSYYYNKIIDSHIINYIDKYGTSPRDKKQFLHLIANELSTSNQLTVRLHCFREDAETIAFVQSLDAMINGRDNFPYAAKCVAYMWHYHVNNIQYPDEIKEAFAVYRKKLVEHYNYDMQKCLNIILNESEAETVTAARSVFKNTNKFNDFKDFMLSNVSAEDQLGVHI